MRSEGDRLSRTEAVVESNAGAVGRLTRKSEADRAAFRSYTEHRDAMVDRLVNYMMRQG